MVATYAVIPKDLNGDHPARLLASWLQNEPSMEVEKNCGRHRHTGLG